MRSSSRKSEANHRYQQIGLTLTVLALLLSAGLAIGFFSDSADFSELTSIQQGLFSDAEPAQAQSCGDDNCQNSFVTFNVNLEPQPCEITNFEHTGNFDIDPGESFQMEWSSHDDSDAALVASGEWSGTKPENGSATQSAPDDPYGGTYTYTLECEDVVGSGGDVDSVQITVNPLPPEFNVGPGDGQAEIDGIPGEGGTATQDITVESLYYYEGDIDLSIINIPPELDGKINFTFSPPSVAPPENDVEEVTITMEVVEPIMDGDTYTITVQGDDGSDVDTTTFQLGLDPFTPREIEEF